MRIKSFAIGLSVCAFIALVAQTSDAAPRKPRVQAGPGWGDCVRTVRALSDFTIRGDAWTWWNNAAGMHERDDRPAVGSVLVFKRSARMGRGHVSLVSRVVDRRTIEVDHTWIAGRGIKRGMQVVDVSPANDWSAVRVWHEPTDQLGQRVYPTYGFILPEGESSGPRIIQADFRDSKTADRFDADESASVVTPKGRKPQRNAVGGPPVQSRMFSGPQASALMAVTPPRKPADSVRGLAVKIERKAKTEKVDVVATPARKPATRVTQQKVPAAATQAVPARKPKAA